MTFFQLPAEQSIPPKYTKEPSGINTLSKLMKNISTSLNLPRVYTNHCVRATTATTLAHAGIQNQEIMKVTGCKNTLSPKKKKKKKKKSKFN